MKQKNVRKNKAKQNSDESKLPTLLQLLLLRLRRIKISNFLKWTNDKNISQTHSYKVCFMMDQMTS